MIYDGAEIGFLLDLASEASCSSQVNGNGTLGPCRIRAARLRWQWCLLPKKLQSLQEPASLWKFSSLCSFTSKSWCLPRVPSCCHCLGSRDSRHNIPTHALPRETAARAPYLLKQRWWVESVEAFPRGRLHAQCCCICGVSDFSSRHRHQGVHKSL